MKRCVNALCLLLFMVIVSSCATVSVEWKYQEDAVDINFKVDPKLNTYNGIPHTLYTVVYQLKDPNAYNQLIEDEQGLYKLLEGKVFDASVASSKTLIVNPGQDVAFTFNRAENAKYIAIVAGYSTMHKDIMARLFEIPVHKGVVSFVTRKAKPGKLKINLELGPQQLKHVEGNL